MPMAIETIQAPLRAGKGVDHATVLSNRARRC